MAVRFSYMRLPLKKPRLAATSILKEMVEESHCFY